MAGLLVSVRSACEARSALAGGASVIDVKEPSRGPLGRSDVSVWAEVREVVSGRAPVSVALGELAEWDEIRPFRAGFSCLDRVPRVVLDQCSENTGRGRPVAPSESSSCRPLRAVSSSESVFSGLSFRKLGLGGEASRPDWPTRWASLRAVLPPGPSWVAVIYADWLQAQAPEPSRILDEAIRAGCSGLLIDTFDKTGGNPLDVTPFWRSLSTRTRSSGLFLALAGRLDRDAMARLAPLEPTLFAVRGAACRDGDRLGPIDPERVARLAERAHSLA